MKQEFKVQVPKESYYKSPDVQSFISYSYQIELIKSLNPETILEIGVGNKVVSNFLKDGGFNLTTCDFAKDLEPDYLTDIRKLPFKNNSYDVILACEILEHLPLEEVYIALKELQRVTKKYVIVSVPYLSPRFELILIFPFIRKILKRKFINFLFRIPFPIKRKFDGQHYWEIGWENCNLKKIRGLFRKRFKILEEIDPVLNPNHFFFILEKK